MLKRTVVLVVGISILGLLAVGCGGGGDDGSSGNSDGAAAAEATNGGEAGTTEANGSETEGESEETTEASPDEDSFTAEANAACEASTKQGRSEILAAYNSPKIKKANTEAQAIQFEVSTLVPILITDAEARVAALSSLEAPSGEEAEVEEIVKSLEAWIQKAKGTPLKVVVANDIFNEARELAGKYPLVKCGLSPFEEP